MKNISSYLGYLFLIFIILPTASIFAMPSGVPYSSATPGGIFSQYFTNMIQGVCPVGQSIIGYDNTPGTSYGTRLCGNVESFWKSNDSGANIFFTGAGNVGVGTNSPGARLDVNGKIKAIGFSSTQGIPNSGDASTNGFAFGSDGDTGIFSPGLATASNGQIGLYSNNVEALHVISNAGNPFIGIGVSNPSAKLDVNGNIKTNAFVFAGNTDTWLRLTDGGSTYKDFAVNQLWAQNQVTASGWLNSINGGVNVKDWLYSSNGGVNVNYVNVRPQNNVYEGGEIALVNSNPESGRSGSIIIDNFDQGLRLFRWRNSPGEYTEYANFRPDRTVLGMQGNVGIGTNTPSAKLDVNGNIKTNGFTFDGNNDSWLRLRDGDEGAYRDFAVGNFWANSNATVMGNLGVGISSPTTKLDVRGVSAGNFGTTTSCCTANFTLGISEATSSNGRLPSIQFHAAGFQEGFLRLASTDRTFEIGDNQGAGANFALRNPANTGRNVFLAANGSSYFNAGNVGIGTTSPSYKLHVAGDILANGWLRTTGNSGWYSETYGGGWYMSDSTWIRGYSDKSLWMSNGHIATNGSLSIGYSAATSSPGNAIIAGNVGIGTSTPSEKLDVVGNIKASGTLTASAIIYSSDRNLKKDITPLQNSLEKILALNGYSFTWKSTGKKDIGVIAQEVEKVFPDTVHTDTTTGLKSVEYANLVAPLIEAVKTQQKQIDDQNKRIESLEKIIHSLQK